MRRYCHALACIFLLTCLLSAMILLFRQSSYALTGAEIAATAKSYAATGGHFCLGAPWGIPDYSSATRVCYTICGDRQACGSYLNSTCQGKLHFDCVGLIKQVFSDHNAMDLLGMSGDQGCDSVTDLYDRLMDKDYTHSAIGEVDWPGRMPGDIVLFRSAARFEHSGIFVGDKNDPEHAHDVVSSEGYPDDGHAPGPKLNTIASLVAASPPVGGIAPAGKRGDFFMYVRIATCTPRLTICKYADTDLDGDGDEPLADWPMYVSGPNNYSNEVYTGSSGCVTIDVPSAGTYTVKEMPDPNVTIFDDPRPGHTKRWRVEGKALQDAAIDECGEGRIIFLNVCLGSITVNKFKDCNMNGTWDAGEDALAGWPFKLTGKTAGGTDVGPTEVVTGTSGSYKVADLDPGAYVISEQTDTLFWDKKTRDCGSQTYCDWQTATIFQGFKWLLTSINVDGAVLRDFCDLSGPQAAVQIACNDAAVTFGNVPLTSVSAFKFHDLNLNARYEPDGEPSTDSVPPAGWTPEEPYTDANCNGTWDPKEFHYDRLKNDKWDPSDPFVDSDGDGLYDYPECVITNWPFKLTGNRADGRPLCLDDGNVRKTGTDGRLTFRDIPPSDAAGYTCAEDLPWCLVDLPTGEKFHRATYDHATMSCAYPPCAVTRWQAIGDAAAGTDIQRMFVLSCEQTHHEDFCNICLSTIVVTKEVYDEGVPGHSPKKPGVGWEMVLAGVDPRGKDVVPSLVPCQPIMVESSPPIQMPCEQYAWYSVTTDAEGNATFYDLLPGHYHLMERADPAYRLAISKPSLCGFDIMCCPEEFTFQNIRLGVPIKIYQAYPGSSEGLAPIREGYIGDTGDAITAVPGILCLEPGKNWENFKQAAQLCRTTPPKDTILTKSFSPFAQCQDIFGPVTVIQHGTPSIRTWWPLMYEPPTTTWTLRLLYGSPDLVQLPGETRPSWVHTDEWKWVVETDIPHMQLFLDLLHELPFGNDEVPLISDELLLSDLKAQLAAAQTALDRGDTAAACLALADFELAVMDSCIDTSPRYPNPTGVGTGIANTGENPACCKLLIDAEYVGKTTGSFQQSK